MAEPQVLSFPDHYAALSVPPTADFAELRAAYSRIRKASFTPASLNLYRAATEAFGVLADPTQRAKYDIRWHAVHELPLPTQMLPTVDEGTNANQQSSQETEDDSEHTPRAAGTRSPGISSASRDSISSTDSAAFSSREGSRAGASSPATSTPPTPTQTAIPPTALHARTPSFQSRIPHSRIPTNKSKRQSIAMAPPLSPVKGDNRSRLPMAALASAPPPAPTPVAARTRGPAAARPSTPSIRRPSTPTLTRTASALPTLASKPQTQQPKPSSGLKRSNTSALPMPKLGGGAVSKPQYVFKK